jgi:hypothetical protein
MDHFLSGVEHGYRLPMFAAVQRGAGVRRFRKNLQICASEPVVSKEEGSNSPFDPEET